MRRGEKGHPMPITTDLNSPIGAIRLLIGDTIENNGMKPDAANFTDTEISYFLQQADNNVLRAAALACDTLAAMWNTTPDFEADGLRMNRRGIARAWQQSATHFRMKAGAVVRKLVRDYAE